jgi:uncharacterized damage-inducible protein DinB
MYHNSFVTEAREVLMQLLDCINQLNFDEYTQKMSLLSDSTIGEHTRHCVELFEQLLIGYETENINYDSRKREIRIQENIDFATERIANIIQGLEKNDKKLMLCTFYNNEKLEIESTYYRELVYNIEHCIHHQAIIKIALLQFENKLINEEFGVANSTIMYRKECVQ